MSKIGRVCRMVRHKFAKLGTERSSAFNSLLFRQGNMEHKIQQKGIEVVIGVQNPLPLSGFPFGKIKIKQRTGKAVKVYVKTKDSIRCFCVKKLQNLWCPAFEIGRNDR